MKSTFNRTSVFTLGVMRKKFQNKSATFECILIKCLNERLKLHFEINFKILTFFEISDCHFCEMIKNIENFFVICVLNKVLFIFLEFESDRTSSRKSVKNEQMGSHGLFCEIFVYYDFIFDKKIY